jgi:hypothetical protein
MEGGYWYVVTLDIVFLLHACMAPFVAIALPYVEKGWEKYITKLEHHAVSLPKGYLICLWFGSVPSAKLRSIG